MSLFAELEGAIAHGKFDGMKEFYGPESQAYFNADPAVASMPASGSAVGPEAIAEAARAEFGGKTVHFNITTLFHQDAPTGAPLLVATGFVHIGTHKFPFSHTVLTAPASEESDSTAFYVRNEILTVTGAGVDLMSGGAATAVATLDAVAESTEDVAPVPEVEVAAPAKVADTGARLPAPSARLPAAIHPKPAAAPAAAQVAAPAMGGFDWDAEASPAAASASPAAAPVPAAAPAVLPPAAAGLPPPSQDLLAQVTPASNGASAVSTSTRGRRRRGAPKSGADAAPAAATTSSPAPAASPRTGTRGAKPAGTRGATKASPVAAAPAAAAAPTNAAPAPAQKAAPAARQTPFSYAAALGTAGSAQAPAPAPQRRSAKPAAKPAAAAASAPAPAAAPAQGVPSARLVARTAPPRDVELSVFVRRATSAPAISEADAVSVFSAFGASPKFIIRNPADGGSFGVKFASKAAVAACLQAGTVTLGGAPATIEARTSDSRRFGGEGAERSSRGGASRARRGNRRGAAGSADAEDGSARPAGSRGRRGGAGRNTASRGAPAMA